MVGIMINTSVICDWETVDTTTTVLYTIIVRFVVEIVTSIAYIVSVVYAEDSVRDRITVDAIADIDGARFDGTGSVNDFMVSRITNSALVSAVDVTCSISNCGTSRTSTDIFLTCMSICVKMVESVTLSTLISEICFTGTVSDSTTVITRTHVYITINSV